MLKHILGVRMVINCIIEKKLAKNPNGFKHNLFHVGEMSHCRVANSFVFI